MEKAADVRAAEGHCYLSYLTNHFAVVSWWDSGSLTAAAAVVA